MNAHTPGPWIADSVHWCKTEGGMVSFRIRGADKRGVCCATSSTKREALEMAANARLVATAPELLDALAAICAKYHCYVGDDADTGNATSLYTLIQNARTLIAKAEGK